MRPRALLLLPCLATLLVLAAAPASAQAAPNAQARKFLALHGQVNARFTPYEKQALALASDKRRDLRSCPPAVNLPNDNYQQIISKLYVLLDMIQEASSLAKADLLKSASDYRAAGFSDPVLKKAARERAKHLQTLADLKPLDSCSIMKGWAAANWPTDWKPTGEVWEAARAIYLPDLQIPDSDPLKRRLKKLGATGEQLRLIKYVAVNERILSSWDRVVLDIFPKQSDVDWR